MRSVRETGCRFLMRIAESPRAVPASDRADYTRGELSRSEACRKLRAPHLDEVRAVSPELMIAVPAVRVGLAGASEANPDI